MSLRYALGVAFFIYGALSVVGNAAEAQTCVGYQEVPITAATRAQATAAGIPETANCWNPNNPKTGADVAKAKQYLDGLWCGPTAGRCGTFKSTVTDLNPKFAGCIAKFLEKARQVDPSICINSAYRSTEHQACACKGASVCAAPGKSMHQQGLAIDVRAKNYAWLHAEVRKFGGLRHLNDPRDPFHIESAGNECADGNYRPSDLPSQSPSTGLTNTIRQALGMQQPQPLAPQSAFPQQPLSNTQSPTGAFSPALPTPTLVPETTSLGTVSPGTSQNPGTPITSVADRLEALTFGVKATSSSPSQSATTVPLVINGTDTRNIQGVTPTTQTTPLTSTTTVGSAMVQQTFVSRDLNQSAPPAPSSNSRTIQILAQLKTALLKMLEYLQPFSLRSIYKTEVYE